MKVKIENFQSITYAEVEFLEGTTVIIGSTNSGKTAIMRSMLAAIHNPKFGKSFIKHGADKSSVTFSGDGLKEVEWIRYETTVSYRVEDEIFTKCGKSNIWDVYPDFPFNREPNGAYLNFHTENDRMFPFGFTSSETFSIFEKIVALDDTASVSQQIKADLSSALQLKQGRIKKAESINEESLKTKENIKKVIEKVIEYIEKYKDKTETKNIGASATILSKTTDNETSKDNSSSVGFTTSSSLTTTVDSSSVLSCGTNLQGDLINEETLINLSNTLLKILDLLGNRRDKIISLNENINSIIELDKRIKEIDQLFNNFDNLSGSYLIERYQSIEKILSNLIPNHKSLRGLNGVIKRLSVYSNLPDKTKIQEFDNLNKTYEKFTSLLRSVEEVTCVIHRMEVTKNLPDASLIRKFPDLVELYRNMISKQESYKELVKISKGIILLSEIPSDEAKKLKLNDSVESTILSLEKSVEELGKIDSCASKLEVEIESLNKLLKEHREALSEFDTCPFCDSVLKGK